MIFGEGGLGLVAQASRRGGPGCQPVHPKWRRHPLGRPEKTQVAQASSLWPYKIAKNFFGFIISVVGARRAVPWRAVPY
jgi:hypothetical protein